MNRQGELPDGYRDLVDDYCSGLIDEAGLRRLETILLDSEAARRHFVAYFHHHTEMQFAIRAGHAAEQALERLAAATRPAGRGSRRPRPWLRRPHAQWWMGTAVGVAVTAVVLGTLWMSRPIRRVFWGAEPSASEPSGNIAWLVNAQDCRWAGKDQEPGRDMRSGKTLELERGLAEIEFERGARVILQGPAGLELVSGTMARLRYGTLTARVPERAKGFTVLSPHGKVVDMGTEFGLSVDSVGATTVRVFVGEVEAFPLAAGATASLGVTVHPNQTAQIDKRTVALDSRARREDAVTYVRAILPPPIRTERTLRLDFTRPIPGTLLDVEGRGVGLTRRLPGTGSRLPERDPNLRLRPDRRALELTTTRSDLNTQERMPTGEYLGFRLSDLGFTGKEDFEISARIPNIPGLKVVGQFGLYAGSKSDQSIRGGLISRDPPDSYRLFLVNNNHGEDNDINELGLMTTGDDMRLTLKRTGGRYSLLADNLTRKSSSTLEIPHPAFLDAQTDLFAGLFAANTQSDLCKTLTISEVKATVWTSQADHSRISPVEPRH
jgi:hypothetical protein